MKTLRLLLGDQLNASHSWYKEKSSDVTYLLMEMRQETDYVQHHIQKVLGFFAAMRAFAEALRAAGHQVIYIKLDDKKNKQGLEENIQAVFEEGDFTHFEYQLPDEYRLDQQLKSIGEILPNVSAIDTEHFLTHRSFLADFFNGKKTYLMESFYRAMRKEYDILMNDKEPEGGKWNYDKENRNSIPKEDLLQEQPLFVNDLTELAKMLEEQGIQTIGSVEAKHYIWPINRKQARQVLQHFVKVLLPKFGLYQDAMHTDDPFLYHARLSFALNTKMLHPLEVLQAVEKAYYENPELNTLPQVEGFIRQILGWREYMRGVYWAKMPDYATLNFFGHERKLPAYFWTGDTKMNCIKHAVDQSLQHAYAHHIQRLMVTGNFLLLAGIDPAEVDAWYLGIYIDAIEWVEITNTRGMSQFADGGIVGTKPYVSSANYIDKMSNYCSGCKYDKKKKYGKDACPFNSLYWHFYDRNEDKLAKNPRIGMMYRTWEKMQPEEKQKILRQAEEYLSNIETL